MTQPVAKPIPVTLEEYGAVEFGRRRVVFEKVKTVSGRILFSLALHVDTAFRKRLLFDLELLQGLIALLQKGRHELHELNAGRESHRKKEPPRRPWGRRREP